MQLRKPYKDINETLHYLGVQVCDSINYCNIHFNGFDDPENLFYHLKSVISYKNDPTGVELIQSVPTMFENNPHGKSGAGDCDCFVVLALSCFFVNGFNDFGIKLFGRSKKQPVHISCYVENKNFDLTNPFYDYERPYRYVQKLKIE